MLKNILPLVAACSIVLLSGCASRGPRLLDPAQQPPMAVSFLPAEGQYINAQGDPATLEDMIRIASGADYVLIGEGHKSLCDHRVQAELLEALAATDTPPAVGFEMIPVDRQPILNDFAQGLVPLSELADELEWKDNWGYDFSMYRTLFEIAQRYSLPLGALNMPKAVAGAVGEKGMGGLSEDEREQAPTLLIPQSEEQEAFLREVFALHDDRDPDNDEQVQRFFRVQSAWDSMMAEQAASLRQRYGWPVVIVVGRGHVENGWGIERRLAILDPTAKVASFLAWRGGDFLPDEADGFFYCPARFKGRMGMVLEFRDQGVVITSVARGSRADKAGLRPGDVLVKAQGLPVESLMTLHMAGSTAHKNGEPLVFTILRDGTTWNVDMGELGKGKPGAGHPGMTQGAASGESDKPDVSTDKPDESMSKPDEAGSVDEISVGAGEGDSGMGTTTKEAGESPAKVDAVAE